MQSPSTRSENAGIGGGRVSRVHLHFVDEDIGSRVGGQAGAKLRSIGSRVQGSSLYLAHPEKEVKGSFIKTWKTTCEKLEDAHIVRGLGLALAVDVISLKSEGS